MTTAGRLSRDGHVGVLYVGGDYLVTRDLIIGALAQFDWAKDRLRGAQLDLGAALAASSCCRRI
jgi:hypothetical protein